MSPKIVILAEDPHFALTLERLLMRQGYAAISVTPGKGTFRRLEEHDRSSPIRLLITDIFMPEPDGFEILRFALRRFPGIPVFGMSERRTEFLEALRALGARGVFRKPIDSKRLLAEIDALLGRPNALPL